MNGNELLIFMDDYRYKRKISQSEFLYGVISQRQYYRYLYNESEPTFEVINKLMDKLGLSFSQLLFLYSEKHDNNLKYAQLFFNYVLSKDFNEAKNNRAKVSNLNHTSSQTSLVINIGDILLNYYSGEIKHDLFVALYCKILQVKETLEKETLTNLEIYFLGILMEYDDCHRVEIVCKFNKLNKEGQFILNGDCRYIIQTYFYYIKNLGRLEMYNDVVDVAEDAIKYLDKISSFYLRADITYFLSYALYLLKNEKRFIQTIESLKHCLYYSKIEKSLVIEQMIIRDTGKSINNHLNNLRK